MHRPCALDLQLLQHMECTHAQIKSVLYVLLLCVHVLAKSLVLLHVSCDCLIIRVRTIQVITVCDLTSLYDIIIIYIYIMHIL